MRHISFDFWNTVGKPNLTYSAKRTEFLATAFETTREVAKHTYTAVKTALVADDERGAYHHGRDYEIERLCEAFGRKADPAFHAHLCNEMDSWFAVHPPTIDHRLATLIHRASLNGITLSIGSNTNFVRGQTIVDHSVGRLPFAFAIFSDEVGVSKPSREFFDLVAYHARLVNPLIRDNRDIVHVGDNRVCDCDGPEAAGMLSAYTKDADETAAVLDALLTN